MNAFINNLCDYNIAIYGCQNSNYFQWVNNIAIALHVICIAIAATYPISKLISYYNYSQNDKAPFNDTLCRGSFAYTIAQLVLIIKLIVMNIADLGFSIERKIVYIKAVMALEYVSLAFAGLGMTFFITYFVEGAVGSNDKLFTLRGKSYNPTKILTFIRILVFICILVLFVLWIHYGVQSPEMYVFYRRIIYYFYTIVAGFITPILYTTFLSIVIKKLTLHYEENDEPIPQSLKYLQLLKNLIPTANSCSIAIEMFLKVFANEYLQQYLLIFQMISHLCSFIYSISLEIYTFVKAVKLKDL
ncbi:hypothetical protein HDV04_004614 [Boothiomyces sp. JEL0838]|nr:hypothetical protein HDV04_004614 [Boothiomyces sp. JEL0838]